MAYLRGSLVVCNAPEALPLATCVLIICEVTAEILSVFFLFASLIPQDRSFLEGLYAAVSLDWKAELLLFNSKQTFPASQDLWLTCVFIVSQ